MLLLTLHYYSLHLFCTGNDVSGCQFSTEFNTRSTSSVSSQLTPPRVSSPCFQFNSCAAMKSSPAASGFTIPQYYPSNVSLLPYHDWAGPRQSSFQYNRFNYEQSKPSQITSFLPPTQEKQFKDYQQAVQDTNLSEWYVCQSTATDNQTANIGQTQDQNSLPLTSTLHQQVLTAGF